MICSYVYYVTSQILVVVDASETQDSIDLENDTLFFFQTKWIHSIYIKGSNMTIRLYTKASVS